MESEETAKEILEEIANTSDLETAIHRLEAKRILLEEGIKVDIHDILNDLKPANILKHTLQEVRESTPLKHNLFKVALGLGAGYFSRKLVVGQTAGVAKKALGTVIQYGITHFISKKPDPINPAGPTQGKIRGFFRRIFSA